jgi:hypothetical protein
MSARPFLLEHEKAAQSEKSPVGQALTSGSIKLRRKHHQRSQNEQDHRADQPERVEAEGDEQGALREQDLNNQTAGDQ